MICVKYLADLGGARRRTEFGKEMSIRGDQLTRATSLFEDYCLNLLWTLGSRGTDGVGQILIPEEVWISF
jgi:hypothetical protein